MYRTIDVLHDYPPSYSDSVLIPKLTQRALLGLLPPVRDHEAVGLVWRRPMWKPISAAPRNAPRPNSTTPRRCCLTRNEATQLWESRPN